MKCEVIIDKNCEEKVVVYTRKENALVKQIKQLAEEADDGFLGYKERQIVKLISSDIYCITVIDGKVYAICEDEKYLLKERLYILEERLPDSFIKVNQSCIANIGKIERFDASISGTLMLTFKNGHTDYVSRRQMKTIKKKVGI